VENPEAMARVWRAPGKPSACPGTTGPGRVGPTLWSGPTVRPQTLRAAPLPEPRPTATLRNNDLPGGHLIPRQRAAGRVVHKTQPRPLVWGTPTCSLPVSPSPQPGSAPDVFLQPGQPGHCGVNARPLLLRALVNAAPAAEFLHAGGTDAP